MFWYDRQVSKWPEEQRRPKLDELCKKEMRAFRKQLAEQANEALFQHQVPNYSEQPQPPK